MPRSRSFLIVAMLTILAVAGCSRSNSRPVITTVDLNQSELPNYALLEMTIGLQAHYTNPYDLGQVSLDGIFQGPDGRKMNVPGFWDGESNWRIRFTPSQVGKWNYQIVVTDTGSSSKQFNGSFSVTPSDSHGWLQPGNWVDPNYSGHYLVYRDGTPFYGIGHDDAFNIMWAGFNTDSGVTLFNDMKKAGENYVVWWPLYSNSPISYSYNDYSLPALKVIDLVVADAQKKGIFLVFTIWDHPELRDSTHAWGTGNWTRNGFQLLGDINSFFTTAEAWAWQENFYRYIIARWGYSPAIGMWQTVSEINGTNAYDQTDLWHKKVNDYFSANDPYRHPTTASMSGDTDWPAGFKVMDAPQVHIYNFENGGQSADVVKAADILAHWTSLMWDREDKPNWVGEFGTEGNTYYPELFHNAIWAALGSGAAMTPAEWNSGNAWGEMTPAMLEDINRLGQFVAGMPLAAMNPTPLQVVSSDPQVRGWGVSGKDGGLFWVQDFSMEGKSIDEVRTQQVIRKGVTITLQGLPEGTYIVSPYDTWQGKYLQEISIDCSNTSSCDLSLPDFTADIAFTIERK